MKVFSCNYPSDGIEFYGYSVDINEDAYTFDSSHTTVTIHGYMKDDMLIPHNEVGPTWFYTSKEFPMLRDTCMFILHGKPMSYEEFTQGKDMLKLAIALKYGNIKPKPSDSGLHYFYE